jgi:hypothetical protein
VTRPNDGVMEMCDTPSAFSASRDAATCVAFIARLKSPV